MTWYLANLARYLAPELDDVDGYLAGSVRLAVRTDLPGGRLAFSHHRYPLDRLPDGTALRYAGCDTDPEALSGLADELHRYGRVLAVVDGGRLPGLSRAAGGPASRWVLVDGRQAGLWHVRDAFPGGRARCGWLGTGALLDAMAAAGPSRGAQRRRDSYAFGFPVALPARGRLRWLRREPADCREPALTGRWLVDDATVLPFLAGRLAGGGAGYLVDLTAAALHRVYRYRRELVATPRDDLQAARLGMAIRLWRGLPSTLRQALGRDGRAGGAAVVRGAFARLAHAAAAVEAPGRPDPAPAPRLSLVTSGGGAG
jgi:hypothetical protein